MPSHMFSCTIDHKKTALGNPVCKVHAKVVLHNNTKPIERTFVEERRADEPDAVQSTQRAVSDAFEWARNLVSL